MGLRLGDWLDTQRNLYKERQLERSRLERLNKVDMGWAGLASDHQWNEMFDALVRHKQEHGDCKLGCLLKS